MKIEIYRLQKYNGKGGNAKAFIDLIIDNEIILKGFALVEGKTGLFLSTPSEKDKFGKYYETIRFNNLETYKEIEKLTIEKYQESLKEIKSENV